MWEILLDISKQLGKLNIISCQNHKEAYGQIFVECQTLQQQLPEKFFKKGVLKNFAKFTKNHLCRGHFFNNVADLRSLLKKRI